MNKIKIINLQLLAYVIFFILILNFELHSAPLKFKQAPQVSSYLHEDFYEVIVPFFSEVSEETVYKALRSSKIYTPKSDIYITDYEGANTGIKIPYKFFIPNPTLSSHIFVTTPGKNFHEVNIIFYETTSKETKIYSRKGFIPASAIELNIDYNSPFWLYGTIALIYADATNYSNKDILLNEYSNRVASLIFIPESKHSLDLSSISSYPYLYVINKINQKTFLLEDRKLLNYFHKYGLEVQDSFYEYKGGAISFKAFLYIDGIKIMNSDNNYLISVNSSPTLFIIEKDLSRKQVFTYQKSPYYSLHLKDKENSIIVYANPDANSNIISQIDKSYYKERNILYTPWNNKTVNNHLWYSIILPKKGKIGYINSDNVTPSGLNTRYEK